MPVHLPRRVGCCSTDTEASTSWCRCGPPDRTSRVIRYRVSGLRRLPAAEKNLKPSRSWHSPTAANEFAVIEPFGRVYRRAFFLRRGINASPQYSKGANRDRPHSSQCRLIYTVTSERI